MDMTTRKDTPTTPCHFCGKQVSFKHRNSEYRVVCLPCLREEQRVQKLTPEELVRELIAKGKL
jgi:hypothetical protein